MKALACWRDPNRSGKTGAYFKVLNHASEYGLSLDTRGREWDRVTSRSASRVGDGLGGHRGAPVGVHDLRDAVQGEDLLHHLFRQDAALVGVDGRPDDVAGVDVDHHVGVVVDALDRAGSLVMSQE